MLILPRRITLRLCPVLIDVVFSGSLAPSPGLSRLHLVLVMFWRRGKIVGKMAIAPDVNTMCA